MFETCYTLFTFTLLAEPSDSGQKVTIVIRQLAA